MLPTDGAARFASGLTVRALPPPHEPRCGSAAPRPRWRAPGVPIAEAEGFAVHAESMAARIRENP